MKTKAISRIGLLFIDIPLCQFFDKITENEPLIFFRRKDPAFSSNAGYCQSLAKWASPELNFLAVFACRKYKSLLS
jgi:hypothetical protein